jgi:hypothetical protein
VAVAIGLISAAVLAGGAQGAGGGSTISAAPPVPLAFTVSGNTSSDAVTNTGGNLGPGAQCPGDGEFWIASLVEGDEVTLKGAALAPSVQMYVDVYAPGTSDATVATAKPLVSAPLVSTGFTATRSGAYPILVGTSPACGGADGPFNLAVYATHKAMIVLPRAASIAHTGTLNVKVESPDGKPISSPHLHLTLYGTYRASSHAGARRRRLGTGTPGGGTVVFSYRLPATESGPVKLEVVGAGAGYQPLAPVTGTVAVH